MLLWVCTAGCVNDGNWHEDHGMLLLGTIIIYNILIVNAHPFDG